ncbi:MAG: DNA gyrase subunit B, partial [Deltaproteobacteria bacterium]|nr:DNA gyrase subunit B [Deltaproteobacteria bacterium]
YLIIPSAHNGTKKIHIGHELVKSDDATRLIRMYKEVELLGPPPFTIRYKEKTQEIDTWENILTELWAAGQKGLGVQRYKGLGEMNPQQLWETTMDPEKRTLLRVRVEDAVESDEIFTILMGDKVEPRRDFIQENALKVRELDI